MKAIEIRVLEILLELNAKLGELNNTLTIKQYPELTSCQETVLSVKFSDVLKKQRGLIEALLEEEDADN